MTEQSSILFVSMNEGEIFIGELAKRLVRRNFNVWRYYVNSGTLFNYRSEERIHLKRLPQHPLKKVITCVQNTKTVSRHLKHIDNIHYHYVDPYVPLLNYFLKPLKCQRKLATFWGSDFYKSNAWKLKWKVNAVKRFDCITFTNSLTESDFRKRFPGLGLSTKTIRFGLSPLEFIDNASSNFTRTEALESLALPVDKSIVGLGTNSSKNQNHLAVIASLTSLSQKEKKLFHFVVPLGYPEVGTSYMAALKDAFQEAGITSYTLDQTFYSGERLALWRLAIDIQIQVQHSDQFSGAMQEALAAGSYVITGKWLPYDLLDKLGVTWSRIVSIEDLPEQLRHAASQPLHLDDKLKNKTIIHTLSHWDKVIEDWISMYASASSRVI